MRKVTKDQKALIMKAIKEKTLIHATLIREVRGGHDVALDGGFEAIAAYLPNILARVGRHSALKMFPSSIPVRIKEFSEKRQSVVVSAMSALRVIIWEGEHRFVSSLKKGDEFTARVQRVVNFGAFVRIGAVDGLLHNSKMPVSVKRGQEIKVRVSHVDVLGHKVSLEMDAPPEKIKTPKPWVGEESTVVHLETMSAKKLKRHFQGLGQMTPEDSDKAMIALRKRSDYHFRVILSGSADWWTAFKEVC